VDRDPFRRLVPAAQGITDEASLEKWLAGKTVAVSATILNGPPLPAEYTVLRRYFQRRTPDHLTRSYSVFHGAKP
jgi:hypothetical protein